MTWCARQAAAAAQLETDRIVELQQAQHGKCQEASAHSMLPRTCRSDIPGTVTLLQRPSTQAMLCHALRFSAMVCHPQGNHIYTSGATGTNAAVIKGALRAENPELLTVILPQSLSRQPQESQELLSQV
jgi:hypothetical protein